MYRFDFDTTHSPISETQLLEVRDRLKETRESIDGVRRQCSDAAFEYARKCVNPYELLQHVDVSKVPHSRCYYKFLEVAAYFPAVLAAARNNTLHLCEAPGSFIDATLHLSQGTAEWHASSLALRESTPFYDHHLRAKKNNGHSRVIFGEDGTGNLLLRDNAICIIHESGNGRCSLVTADGGADGLGSDQEANHTRLFAAQTYTALQALQPGGCFVLKLYDCFLPSTRHLLWLCHSLFECTSLVKLCASRVCNSERYLVCTGYQATPLQLKTSLNLLDKVAFSDAELTTPNAPSPEAEGALNKALVDMATLQMTGLRDSVTLTAFLHSTGITTLQETRQHYNEHLTHNNEKVLRARQLLAQFPQQMITNHTQ